jgi:hypothetical protein
MDYSLNILNQFAVNRPGSSEVIRMPLYDYQLYPAPGAAQFTFFQQPIGQGLASSPGAPVPSAKTYADTNMESAGLLPRPKSQLIESIEVVFEPGSVATAGTYTPAVVASFNAVAAAALLDLINDVNTMRQSGWLELYIGSKVYLWQGPLGSFPPQTRLELDAAIASNSATTAEIAVATAKFGGKPFFLDPPITLESMQNFSVSVKFPAAVATPSTNNGRIGIVMDGVQFRNSQ